MNFEDACKSNDKTQRELHRQRNAASFYARQRARKLNIAERLRRALGLKVHRVERQAKFLKRCRAAVDDQTVLTFPV